MTDELSCFLGQFLCFFEFSFGGNNIEHFKLVAGIDRLVIQEVFKYELLIFIEDTKDLKLAVSIKIKW